MLSVRQVRAHQLGKLLRITEILYACGKDMAEKYGLQHWNNSKLKTLVIVALCVLKNRIFLGMDKDGKGIVTIQARIHDGSLHVAKLAVLPSEGGKGYGSVCLKWMEEYARANGCKTVELEVYDQSRHAIAFYEHCGYTVCGSAETLKYREIQMKKML